MKQIDRGLIIMKTFNAIFRFGLFICAASLIFQAQAQTASVYDQAVVEWIWNPQAGYFVSRDGLFKKTEDGWVSPIRIQSTPPSAPTQSVSPEQEARLTRIEKKANEMLSPSYMADQRRMEVVMSRADAKYSEENRIIFDKSWRNQLNSKNLLHSLPQDRAGHVARVQRLFDRLHQGSADAYINGEFGYSADLALVAIAIVKIACSAADVTDARCQ